MGESSELTAEAISGTVMMIPIAVESSAPLNHLATIAAYAIMRFSEQIPNAALPSSITG
jgi:hypothetical protein